jgi:ABC-type multidrug transport system, ATPase and permease components
MSKGGPMGHGRRPSEKAKNFKGTMKKFLVYLKPFLPKIIFAMIFAIASTIFSIVGPKILGKATTSLAEGIMHKATGVGGIDFDYILKIIMILVGMYVVSALCNYIQNFNMTTVSQKVAYNLRNELASKVDRLPLAYFDKVSHGEVLSRVTNDIDTIAQSLNQSLSQMLTSAISVIGITVMMLSISWQMTIFAFCVLPLSMILMGNVVKHSQKYFALQQAALGEVNGHIEEMYGGHETIRAFSYEKKSIQQFQGLNEKLFNSAFRSQFLSGLTQPIIAFIGNIGYVGVCLLGGYFTIQGVISLGDIQAFTQYMRQFNQPIGQVAQIMNVLQSTVAAAERVFEFLEEDELEEDVENPIEIYDENKQIKIHGSVTFDHVCFGYNPDKIIIHDFNIHLHAGQKVAIVGPTGAGKTTIVKLLMRFYELNSGAILIDGCDIKNYRRQDLCDLFGMVLQDAWLFNGTVMENLRYGKLEASDEQVKIAAKNAYVDHFINTLENGYDTLINEESNNISQGQKQLLTIARAFLADPKILILDEATSSVDTRTEILIQKGMEKLMEGRTSFIIAHRLSTIRNADIILVMKDGDIVEVGNHDDLMTRNGFYAELYNSQFEEN